MKNKAQFIVAGGTNAPQSIVVQRSVSSIVVDM